MSAASAGPSLSVVIPAFNRPALLGECLKSVARQTTPADEVIVVDDGSMEELQAVVNACEAPVRYIRQPNSGQATARNTGIDAATSDYVVFIDSDDIWPRQTLETLRHVIQANDLPALVLWSPLKFADSAPDPVWSMADVAVRAWPNLYDEWGTGSRLYTGAGAMAFRRAAIGRERFPAVRVNCEDLAFLMRIGNVGPYIRVTQPELLLYRQHPENSVKNLSSTRKGLALIAREEIAGVYPGGSEMQSQRRLIISIWCSQWIGVLLQHGMVLDALRLFWAAHRVLFSVPSWRRRMPAAVAGMVAKLLRRRLPEAIS